MTTVQFYRGYVWSPIVVGALMLSAFAAGWEPAGSFAAAITIPLAVSIFFGGIPYTALAAWTTWWLGGKTEAQIRRRAFLMPLLMLGIYSTWALVYGGVTDGILDGASYALMGVAYTLTLGYAYVGLGFVIHAALRRLRYIACDETPTT